ncbi:MAG: GGDEF domain-containing protein [Peptococcaceae bacterium]|jgi:diguanylate cyclase (GGDEF)-like protein|nr:GGDEF domain-containing protein [Peptococcaceae bacterium]
MKSSDARFMRWVPFRFALCGMILAAIALGVVAVVSNRIIIWIVLTLILTFFGYYVGWNIRELYIEIYTDKLTRVGNRNMFHQKMQECLLAVREQRLRDVSLAMIDIDHFKKVNDTYGHMAGDQVLSELATLLKRSTRKTDVVIRWGGEEFVVILPNAKLTGAHAFMNRMRSTVESHHFEELGDHGAITISVGLSAYKELESSGVDMTEDATKILLTAADNALYEAKKYRNEVAAYHASRGKRLERSDKAASERQTAI